MDGWTRTLWFVVAGLALTAVVLTAILAGVSLRIVIPVVPADKLMSFAGLLVVAAIVLAAVVLLLSKRTLRWVSGLALACMFLAVTVGCVVLMLVGRGA